MNKIDKYLEISDRLNAPVLIEDDTKIIPVEEPYPFIQPSFINWDEFDEIESLYISIRNVGGKFLIISSVHSDVDWIRMSNNIEKKALEWSDDPMILALQIDRARLPAGDQTGNIIIEIYQETKTVIRVPVYISVSKEDAASILASPDVIDFGLVPIHKDHTFTFESDSDAVYLQGDFTNWELGRIPMIRTDDGKEFRTSIKLDDGEYLYQFSADDRNLPDPNNQQRIVIGEHGTCSKLSLNRFNRNLQISNIGSKSLKVKLNPLQDISISESEFSIGKGEKRQIIVSLLPGEIKLGANTYNIDIQVKSRQVGSVEIRANGYANGPVADILTEKIDLGEVFSGNYIAGNLRIRNTGSGTSVINLMSSELLEGASFEFAEGAETEIPVVIKSDQISPGDYRSNITVNTNNYIYGTDQYTIPLEFKLVSMEIDPQEIDFGTMYVNQPIEKQIRARRSDGSRMDLGIAQEIPPWIEAIPSGRQAVKVKINWERLHLESDVDLEATISLIDERSSLNKPIKVIGRVLIPHIAVDELRFESDNRKKKSLLPVKNMGNGKLIIYKIEVSEEQRWLYVEVKKKKKLIYVKLNRRLIPAQDRENHLTSIIRILSNDPIEPVTDVHINIDGLKK